MEAMVALESKLWGYLNAFWIHCPLWSNLMTFGKTQSSLLGIGELDN